MKPLEIRVDTLPHEGREISFHFPPEDVDAELRERGVSEVRLRGDLTGKARMHRSGADVYVIGGLSAPVRLGCVRCLEPFDAEAAGEFHLTFSSEVKAEDDGEERDLTPEELDVEPLGGDALDLAEIVAEQFLLALPPYPVCRESCKGLCPRCGADKNKAACACDREAVDPRFAALGKLKKN